MFDPRRARRSTKNNRSLAGLLGTCRRLYFVTVGALRGSTAGRPRGGVGDAGLDAAFGPFQQGADAPAGGALGVVRQVLFRIRDAGDVQVGPGDELRVAVA